MGFNVPSTRKKQQNKATQKTKTNAYFTSAQEPWGWELTGPKGEPYCYPFPKET